MDEEIEKGIIEQGSHSPIEKNWEAELRTKFLDESPFWEHLTPAECEWTIAFIRREKQLSYQAGKEQGYRDGVNAVSRSEEGKEEAAMKKVDKQIGQAVKRLGER